MRIVNENNIAQANAITHAGIFHADEVLATAVLDLVFDDLVVCRVNEVPQHVPADAIVYDIGNGPYDHHGSINRVRPNGVPYSSAGLIWRDYGRCLVQDVYDPDWAWSEVDSQIVQGVDAVDNGYPVIESRARMRFHEMTFSGLVSLLNPTGDVAPEERDKAFSNAVDFARDVLECLLLELENEQKGRREVERYINRSNEGVMVMRSYVPWKKALLDSSNPKAKHVLFVVYPSPRGGYNWQCVPKFESGYSVRKPVPKSWRGLSGVKLQRACGVADASFCHKSGFLGAAESKDGAVKMARLAALRGVY